MAHSARCTTFRKTCTESDHCRCLQTICLVTAYSCPPAAKKSFVCGFTVIRPECHGCLSECTELLACCPDTLYTAGTARKGSTQTCDFTKQVWKSCTNHRTPSPVRQPGLVVLLQHSTSCTGYGQCCRYLLSSDSKLQNIKPFQGSPVTWFRNPYAHLILVSAFESLQLSTADFCVQNRMCHMPK